MKTTTRAGHRVIVDGGNWYDDFNHDDNDGSCYDKGNHDDNRRKGGGSGGAEKEPAAAAEAAEVAAVAKARADNNQQSAVKTRTAAIAVGKRRQARGEKRWGQRGPRGGAWRRRRLRWRRWRWQRWPMGRGQR